MLAIQRSADAHCGAANAQTYRLIREHKLSSFDPRVAAFANLFQLTSVQLFMEQDRNCVIADNYLLSMAFIYMQRAHYAPHQYTMFNLLVALYLAHEVEEDEMNMKIVLMQIAAGGQPTDNFWSFFQSRKTKLWHDIQCRAYVSRAACENLMQTVMPGNYIWRRWRRHVPHMRRGFY